LPTRDLTILNEKIQWQTSIKYLGIILDKSLLFAKHIDYAIKRFNLYIKILYSFINRNSKLSLKNKLILFKTIFRPVLTYGSPIWGNCAETHRNKLQIAQNKLLKTINNLPWFFSTVKLHELSNIEKLNNYINKINEKFVLTLQYSSNPLIREIQMPQ